ncbi:hypothetical protein CANCADRAFT_142576 [Tortispora caseinolytica NRRL Y-17796]|uniref:Alpha/beta hydrolase fold-3 domain-containing protein n=1 Tax=Tortispora caseinolytica NRRL Y-17796 TaxID=767744 RepID=A0A1E4TDA6_9ASCO|nr:hypothetical protein CANCADRAFT_142576 [Tortispora caseinolytica NRRL Y-17796]
MNRLLNWLRITLILLKNPIATLRFLVRTTKELAATPFRRIAGTNTTSLYTAVSRAVYGSAFYYLPDTVYKASWDAGRGAKYVAGEGFRGYQFPADDGKFYSSDVTILFAHGGGFFVGDALMYEDTFWRWIKVAQSRGLKLALFSLEYPLVREQRYPGCLNAFMAAYDYLLERSPRTSIAFAGDSAGGGLCSMALFKIRDEKTRPLPCLSVLISPWLDLGFKYPEKQQVYNDWLIYHLETGPAAVQLFVPENGEITANDPRISPINNTDFAGIGNVLVLAGSTEILVNDSRIFASKAARDKLPEHEIMYVEEPAQVHTYAMGGIVVSSRAIEQKTDNLIIDQLAKHATSNSKF